MIGGKGTEWCEYFKVENKHPSGNIITQKCSFWSRLQCVGLKHAMQSILHGVDLTLLTNSKLAW